MKCLIIGAAGFVGGYLIESLQKDGDEIYATKLPFENIPYQINIIDMDITESNKIVEILERIKPDVIFHLAAQSSVKLSWSKPHLTVDVNIKGAINVFEAVKTVCRSAKVVVIGSSEEYGDIDYNNSISEETEPNPNNIYAISKYAQEKLAKVYVQAYGLNIVLTRSFNHIGPRQAAQFVVADFCSQVAKIEKGEQEPIIRVGNLKAYRDFTDVRDVVEAYKFLGNYGVSGNIYNVGSGESIQIKQILSIILSFSDVPINVVIDESKFRPIDITNIVADITKIKKLGWQPKISLNTTLMDTLNYFRGLL